ncbi:methyltransferase domain-containing protein [Candidatus Shapirobacteria bacterium]|nr:methyltransferase domain-containing protein [Candidatus Shapirobacteria bacterium]
MGKIKNNAANWDVLWKKENNTPIIHKELIEAILKTVRVENKKILEIGAGLGGDLVYLAKLGGNCTAVDISETSLKRIKQLAKKNDVQITTIKCDARKLIFKEKSFDIIFHQGFLEHFKDPMPLLKEQKRLLKGGGILLIDVPQKYNFYTAYKHWKKFKKEWQIPWETEYTQKQLYEMIKDIKLNPKLIYCRSIFPPGVKKMIAGKPPKRLQSKKMFNYEISQKIIPYIGKIIRKNKNCPLFYQCIGIVAQKE